MMTNRPNGTLYVGVTNNLRRRVNEHKAGNVEGFTKKYALKTLVYYEGFSLMMQAVAKETNMKNWPRAWKIRRILAVNPEWKDLAEGIAL